MILSPDRVVHRPTVARVDLDAVTANYWLLRRFAGNAEVCAVVKADAYGHGMIPVAKALEGAGCTRFAVSNVDEGLCLRDAAIRTPVLLLFGLDPVNVDAAVSARLTPLIYSLELLARLEEKAKSTGQRLGIHLDFDTGMSRMGLKPEEAGAAADILRNSKGLCLEGVSTHFARAGESEDFTELQLSRFDDVVGSLKTMGLDPGFVHAANSAACMGHPKALFSGARAGIALYGAAPEPGIRGGDELRPALEWTSAVMLLRNVPTGTPLSYGGAFVTLRDSLIATIPVGYADGYRRGLGGKGEVIVRGKRAPVVGRVCMDLTLVDVTDVPGVSEGDEIVLIGRRGGERISVEDLASKLDTISYEILCGIGKRVPRIYEKLNA